jgi:cytochrome c oxidase assembly protein subunit 11
MRNRNTSLALNLLLVVAGMLALSYASVPLYRLFCQATGYGGTTQKGAALADGAALAHEITIGFNADIDPSLPWEFRPGEQRIRVKVGQQQLTHYVARNLTQSPVTGRAVYNVVPFAAGAYFVKVECFCFSEQTLAPGQQVNMPVSFYIDPAIMDDPQMKNVSTITLSYTFFPVKTERKLPKH